MPFDPLPAALGRLPLPAFTDPRCSDYLLTLLADRWKLDAADRSEIEAWVERESPGIRAGTSRVFIAVHHGNFPQLEYLAHGLRGRGVRTLATYVLSAAPPDTFDGVLECRGSLGRLFALVAALPATTIYLQAHGRWSFLSQLIEAAHPEHRVVQEVWDWMDAFVDPGSEQAFVDDGVFAAAEITLMRVSERYIRQRTAGFLYKDCGAPMSRLLADAAAPSHRFVPCPPRAWQRAPQPRPGGPWRLVHAGQLKNASSSSRAFGDLHYLPMIRALTEQGMQVSAFASNTPAGQREAVVWSDYVQEAQRNPDFSFHARTPVAQLPSRLSGAYDFGLIAYRFGPELCVGRAHLRAAVASKLFAYLAAGLPVLVSAELEAMADFVTEHGVGVVLDAEDIPRLRALLDRIDLGHMARNVARAQQRFHLERHLPGLVDFLDGVAR